MASGVRRSLYLAEAGLLMTSEQQLTGPLLPICRRNIQMSKSMRSIWNTRWEYLYLCGITAGIDLALAMVEEDHGASVHWM